MKKYFLKNKIGPVRNATHSVAGGYTIIETMISVSLFLIIVTIGMGSLLNANMVHKKSQDMRSIIDNLNFVMEDMSRNLRTGYGYHCIDDGVTSGSSILTPHSCATGGGVSFKSSLGGQWVYYITPDEKILKSVDGGSSFIQLTPDEIKIESVSYFKVEGAEPPPGDSRQPFVTIKLVGRITYNEVESPFSLQTSVSQRNIDI